MSDAIRSTHALRLGFRQIGGFSEADGRMIEAHRGAGFDSVRDLWLRTRLKPAVLERLAAADAFRSLGLSRREALWAIRALRRSGDKDDLPLFARVAMPELEPDAALPPMPSGQQVVEDYRHLHLSLRAHPVSFLRRDLAARGVTPHDRLRDMPNGRRVTIGGLVLVRQRPGTAKGVIFATLEDETGIANTVIWQGVFERFRPIVLGARLISVSGRLQNVSDVVHVVAEEIEDLTHLPRRLSDDGATIDGSAPADAAKHPVATRQRHPRSGDALVTAFRDGAAAARELGLDVATSGGDANDVMPKGRNFH
jgi:error-prone DNA polymerase